MAAASATGTSSRSPVRRSRTSMVPSARLLADHDDRRHPEQLGVLELHARRDAAAVVVEDVETLRHQVVGERLGRVEHRVVLAGGHQVHVDGSHRARPAEPDVVEGRLGDRGDRPGRPDAVGPHRDHDLLAVLVEHLEVERLGVLAAELEDVAHLDAARGDQGAAVVVRARVALAHRGGLDRAVAGEVAAGDEVEDVPARLVRARDPAGALDHPRVEQVAHAGRLVGAQRGRADVAPDQPRVGREVLVGERLDDRRQHDRPRAASGRPRGRPAGRSPAARSCRPGAAA